MQPTVKTGNNYNIQMMVINTKSNHNMRFLTFLILIMLAFTTCKGKHTTSDEITDLTPQYQDNENLSATPTLKYFPIHDDKHQVIGAFPYPKDWFSGDKSEASVFAQNPNGSKVFLPLSYYATDYKSEKSNKEYSEMGLNTAAYKTVEMIIQNDFTTYADSLNFNLKNTYELPELAEIHKKNELLYASFNKPKEEIIRVVATEWLNDKNIKSLVVLKHHTKTYATQTIWGFTIYTMEAPEIYFDISKETFLNSLNNYKTCYQFIFEENKKTLTLKSSYKQTSQYFTPKQKQAKQEAIWKERKRTETYQTNTFEDYLKHLKAKGFITDTDPSDICNLTAYYEQEKDTKHYIESLYTSDSSSYDPKENNDYENWSELTKTSD